MDSYLRKNKKIFNVSKIEKIDNKLECNKTLNNLKSLLLDL